MQLAERMYNILPLHKRAAAASCIVPHQQPFEVLYRLNCDNLCADFQEDLSFRFSYGLTALIQRFQGKHTNKIALKNPPQYTPVITNILCNLKLFWLQVVAATRTPNVNIRDIRRL